MRFLRACNQRFTHEVSCHPSALPQSPWCRSSRPGSHAQAETVQRDRTYGQILKSSAVIGGSSVVNIGLGIVRTKVMALLLGPAGVGLLGIYNSISDLARTVAGMGINSSGVRQIAEAVGTGDTERIARTVTTLRRVALLLGLLGPCCWPRSACRFRESLLETTGTPAPSPACLWWCCWALFPVASWRCFRACGALGIWPVPAFGVGSLGPCPAILIIYFYGNARRGIVPSLVCVAAMGIVVSWWYSRKTQVERVPMRWAEVSAEVSALLKLGFVFMASGFMAMGVAYLVRIIVLRKMGEDAAGLLSISLDVGRTLRWIHFAGDGRGFLSPVDGRCPG